MDNIIIKQRKMRPYDEPELRSEYRGFSEFRGNQKPPQSLGKPGDVFFDEEQEHLYVRTNSGWSNPWDGSSRNRIAHPLFSNRYLWIVDSRLEFCSHDATEKNKFFVKGELWQVFILLGAREASQLCPEALR